MLVPIEADKSCEHVSSPIMKLVFGVPLHRQGVRSQELQISGSCLDLYLVCHALWRRHLPSQESKSSLETQACSSSRVVQRRTHTAAAQPRSYHSESRSVPRGGRARARPRGWRHNSSGQTCGQVTKNRKKNYSIKLFLENLWERDPPDFTVTHTNEALALYIWYSHDPLKHNFQIHGSHFRCSISVIWNNAQRPTLRLTGCARWART